MNKPPSVTDALSVLISVLVIGIPTSLLVSDKPVTWPGLVLTLVWAAVAWSVGQLLFIGLRVMIRALHTRIRTRRPVNRHG